MICGDPSGNLQGGAIYSRVLMTKFVSLDLATSFYQSGLYPKCVKLNWWKIRSKVFKNRVSCCCFIRSFWKGYLFYL